LRSHGLFRRDEKFSGRFYRISEQFYNVRIAFNAIRMFARSKTYHAGANIGPRWGGRGVAVDNTVAVYLKSWLKARRKGSQLLPWILLALMSTGSLFAQNSDFAYVADEFSNAVSLYGIDATTGALTPQGVFSATAPADIVVTASGKFAFVANYIQQGSISVFSINPTTGALVPVAGSPFQAGAYTLRVTIAPSGRFLYAANNGSNNISAFSIDGNTGVLTPVPGSPFDVGKAPYMVGISPSGQFAYVPNANSDTISAFTIDPNTGALTPIPGSPFIDTGQSKDPLGSGASPQGVTVAPSGQFAYVANAFSWTISTYTINPTTGALTPLSGSPLATAPEPAQITFNASGQFAYVQSAGTPFDRLDGSISVYSVNTTTGVLTPIQGSPFASGAATDFFALDASAGFAYAANYYSNDIAGFKVDSATGGLTPIAGSPFKTGSNPHSIAIVHAAGCASGDGSVLSLSSIYPASGGNAGSVTVTVRGCGLSEASTLKLTQSGQPDIPSGPANVLTAGTLISATFNLTGKPPGVWDIAAANPDGTSASLPGGFTIQEGGTPNISVDILGFDKIRVGSKQTFYVVYSNSGNVDAGLVPLWMQVPESVQITPMFPIGSAGSESASTSTNPVRSLVTTPSAAQNGSTDFEISTSNGTFIPLLLPFVPAGSSGSLPIQLAVSSALAPFNWKTWANPPWITHLSASGAKGDPKALKCISDIVQTAFVLVVPESAPLLAMNNLLAANQKSDQIQSGVDFTIALAKQAGAIGTAIDLLDNADSAWGYYSTISDCAETAEESSEVDQTESPVNSLDPNATFGPRGYGPARYISGNRPLTYSTSFANSPTATAPAQAVTITNSLDVNKFDISSLALGPISFASTIVSPPTGASSFSQNVDLRPAQNLIVAINAGIDPSTGVITWRFQSLDPSTGQPPTDPLSGFLPADVNPPDGEGGVVFTVKSKTSLQTGTQLRDGATITFDTNPPINTAPWTNTLDSTPPTSHVVALPPNENAVTFPVSWAGTDVGAGIQDFTIFASDNGAPFTVWQQNIPAKSASFTGQVGHTYAFYSVARDLVGNVEPGKTSAEATTTVTTADTTPPTISITTPANGAIYSANQVVKAAYTCTDAGSGSGIASCTGTVPNGANIDTAPSGTSTAKTFAVNATDVAGNPASKAVSYTVSCHYVGLGISPSTVARGGKITVTGTVNSCTSSSQTVSVKFTLTGPLGPKSCASCSTVMFTSPPFTIPAGTKKTISFPFVIPKTACPGKFTLTATTLAGGTAVDSSSATLTVQ
jgi:6-phosphogluconolactonase